MSQLFLSPVKSNRPITFMQGQCVLSEYACLCLWWKHIILISQLFDCSKSASTSWQSASALSLRAISRHRVSGGSLIAAKVSHGDKDESRTSEEKLELAAAQKKGSERGEVKEPETEEGTSLLLLLTLSEVYWENLLPQLGRASH